MEAWASSRPAT